MNFYQLLSQQSCRPIRFRTIGSSYHLSHTKVRFLEIMIFEEEKAILPRHNSNRTPTKRVARASRRDPITTRNNRPRNWSEILMRSCTLLVR